jgi:hypothetical protein
MSDNAATLQRRSELLRPLEQVTEFVTSPAPVGIRGQIEPVAEREWAARSGSSDLAGVVGRLTSRLTIGLAGAIRRQELVEKLKAQNPEGLPARVVQEILLAACRAWPACATTCRGWYDPKVWPPDVTAARQELSELLREWVKADTETFTKIRLAFCDTVRDLLDRETTPTLDLAHSGASPASSPVTPATNTAPSSLEPAGERAANEAPVKKGRIKKGMAKKEANEKAMELVKQMGKEFFSLSQNEQARRIGTTWRTWSETPFYKEAQRQGKIPQARPGKGAGTPPIVSLTANLEAVAVEGGRNQVLDEVAANEKLKKLVAESKAENARDPSPLDSGPKKVYRNKRL